ncbi:DUF1572 domain-containing protein [Hymenobacter sp. BT635]|uniref:DUF1572 domain-containing protein n=1 Tax=Hymenobacter nitidus TaxID=2880929 RepID=A0ABS8A908_9BACT|nr:DinB family protein [Hymenobacter nitidus]MCB2376877.1 DUF1572 domain-containing protein [Hymenobacter nitidus]
MLIETLRQLFARDLNRLHHEIGQYQDERNLWRTDAGIANPAGNLCLHLVGNLNTYIGAELGGEAYTRNREQEFALQHVPRQELLEKVTDTARRVDQALQGLPATALTQEYPQLVFEAPMTTGYFLMHLATHLTYHLGQINYHRRLLDTRV